MGGGYLPEEEWERVFRMKRHLEDLIGQHTLADVMAREKSPYLATQPGIEGNRAERRKQAAKNRKGWV